MSGMAKKLPATDVVVVGLGWAGSIIAKELADEGLVEKRRGLGMFMTEQAATQLRSSERDRFLNEEWPAVLERIQRLGLSLDELLPQGKV